MNRVRRSSLISQFSKPTTKSRKDIYSGDNYYCPLFYLEVENLPHLKSGFLGVMMIYRKNTFAEDSRQHFKGFKKPEDDNLID